MRTAIVGFALLGVCLLWGCEPNPTGPSPQAPAASASPIIETLPTGKGTGPSIPSVSAGNLHTCAVTTANSIACWGIDDGGGGDVGQVTDAPTSTNFTQVDAGPAFNCAVKTDNSIVCWRDDSFGQATPPVFIEGRNREKR